MVDAVLVGCGSITRTWLDAVRAMPDIRMVGFVDLDVARAQERAAAYGWHDAVVGDDLAAALERTRPDVIFNCTVPEAHVSVTLEALRHGCHVLGEKPLADSMENARRLVAAAEENGRLFAVLQNRRYDANVRRVSQFIKSGVLGAITTVNCDFYIGAHFGGFRDHMQHVLLLDMAIHTFDAARQITGGDATSVYCHEWNPAGSWYDHHASAAALFRMTNGIVYTYRGSWCSEGLNTTWEGDWRIIGDKGSLRWDGGKGIQAQVAVKGGTFISELTTVEVPAMDDDEKTGGHAGNIREFIRCVRQGGVPETAAADNIKSLAMVFAAVESAETHRPVDL